MKKHIFRPLLMAAITCSSLFACSKTSDSPGNTGANPPGNNNPPTTTQDPPKKLIKLTNGVWSTGDISNDSLVYDASNRVILLAKVSKGTGSNPSIFLDNYTFYYNGTDSLPFKYDYKTSYTSGSSTLPPSEYTSTYGLAYDAQGRLVVDSTITTSSPFSNYKRKRSYSYGSDYAVKTVVFPNDTASNSLDSFFFDGNRCAVRRVSGHLDRSGRFTMSLSSSTQFGTVSAGYSLLKISPVNDIAFGFFSGSKLETTGTTYNYYATSTSTYGASYQYTFDATGLLQKIVGSYTGGGISSFTEQLVYY